MAAATLNEPVCESPVVAASRNNDPGVVYRGGSRAGGSEHGDGDGTEWGDDPTPGSSSATDTDTLAGPVSGHRTSLGRAAARRTVPGVGATYTVVVGANAGQSDAVRCYTVAGWHGTGETTDHGLECGVGGRRDLVRPAAAATFSVEPVNDPQCWQRRRHAIGVRSVPSSQTGDLVNTVTAVTALPEWADRPDAGATNSATDPDSSRAGLADRRHHQDRMCSATYTPASRG